MFQHIKRIRALVALSAALGLTAVSVGVWTPAAAAPSHPRALIQGSGSSWSANAVNQWISDVTSQGIKVVFTGSGSFQGRSDFAQGVTDFGVSDIGYQGVDPGTGAQDSNCVPGKGCRGFAYEPIVAGGTSFPYHLSVGGHLVRNLRLSGQTLAKIFTFQITNWNDPAITKDNNGRKLPSLPIIPVVHSEGSGSTAQFTAYLNAQYPSIWQPFSGVKSFLEYYPQPKSPGVSYNGSDGVMNFISSGAANGAIGYDEYSYALAQNFPVAAVLNRAGYYTLPTQYNVAVALQHAQINLNKSSPDYLLQKLNNVYVAPEPQAYPISSYSYFLIPTGAKDPRMTLAKRQTLADFLFYDVCAGQKEMGPIGYSPLPSVLVQASFQQTVLLNKADPKVDVSQEEGTSLASCNNPTFVAGHLDVNRLAQIAPQPLACQKVGAGPCVDGASTPGQPNATGGSSASGGSTGGGAAAGGSGGGGTASGAAGLGGALGAAGSVTSRSSAASNPLSGLGGTGTGSSGNGGGSGSGSGTSQPVDLADYRSPNLTGLLAPLAVVEILAVLVVPPAVYFFVLARRRRRGL